MSPETHSHLSPGCDYYQEFSLFLIPLAEQFSASCEDYYSLLTVIT
jgi:hypothetical protein